MAIRTEGLSLRIPEFLSDCGFACDVTGPGTVQIGCFRGCRYNGTDLRVQQTKLDQYSDVMWAFGQKPDGSPFAVYLQGSARPGAYWVKHSDYNKERGCPTMPPGQYQYKRGDHKGHEAMVQAGRVVVIRDVGYFLGEDGVYIAGPNGVENISRDTVHSWFATDTYFNRSRFPYAFAHWNPKYDTYELHLAGVGDSTETRWVSYDIKRQKWLGPHKTGALTPTSAALMIDSNDLQTPVMGGSDGIIYTMNRAAYTDGTATAIDFDVYSKFHSADTPDILKQWLQPSIITKVQASGTLTVTPYVGGLDAGAGAAISHDLTKGREKLRRLGPGRFARFRLRQATNAVGVAVYGYELESFELGRR